MQGCQCKLAEKLLQWGLHAMQMKTHAEVTRHHVLLERKTYTTRTWTQGHKALVYNDTTHARTEVGPLARWVFPRLLDHVLILGVVPPDVRPAGLVALQNVSPRDLRPEVVLQGHDSPPGRIILCLEIGEVRYCTQKGNRRGTHLIHKRRDGRHVGLEAGGQHWCFQLKIIKWAYLGQYEISSTWGQDVRSRKELALHSRARRRQRPQFPVAHQSK